MSQKLIISKLTKVVVFVFILIVYSFVTAMTASAASTTYTTQYYNSQADLLLSYDTTATRCSVCNTIAECWNSASVGATDCGNACYGGSVWTKYTVDGCYQTFYDPYTGSETCAIAYVKAANTCSTGDKCVGSETGLHPGFCDCSSSASTYKYCCTAAGAAESCTTVGATQDNNPPPEGQCPGGYLVDGSRVRSSACVQIIPDCNQVTCDDCTSITIKPGMTDTCSAGNATGTGCTYKKNDNSTTCTQSAAPDQTCNITCDPTTQNCYSGKCIGNDSCSITHTTPTPTSTTITLTRPTNCTDAPTWSGDITEISGTSYTATDLTAGTYNIAASVCGKSCSDSFIITPTETDTSYTCNGTSSNPCACSGGGCPTGTDNSCCHRVCLGAPNNQCTTVAGVGNNACTGLSDPICLPPDTWSGSCVDGSGGTQFRISGGTPGIRTHARIGDGSVNAGILWQGATYPASGTLTINNLPPNTPFTWYYEQAVCPEGKAGEMTGSCYGGNITCPVNNSSGGDTPVAVTGSVTTDMLFQYQDGSPYDGYGLTNILNLYFMDITRTWDGSCNGGFVTAVYLNGFPYTEGHIYAPPKHTEWDAFSSVYARTGYSNFKLSYTGTSNEYAESMGSHLISYVNPQFPANFRQSITFGPNPPYDGGIASTCNPGGLYYLGGWYDRAMVTVRPPTTLTVTAIGPTEPVYAATVGSNYVNFWDSYDPSSGHNINPHRCSANSASCTATGYYRYSSNPANPSQISVTLTATPGEGYYFSRWTGCDTSSGTTCTIKMYDDKNVTAYFVPIPAIEEGPAACQRIKVNGGDVYSGTGIRMACTSPIVIAPEYTPIILPAPKPAQTHTLSAEFSGTQGGNGWYYYYIKGNTIAPLTYGATYYGNAWHRDGSWWGAIQNNRAIAYADITEPTVSADAYMIYWKAPSAGIATITVTDTKQAWTPDGNSKNDGYSLGLGYTKSAPAWPPQDWKQVKVAYNDTPGPVNLALNRPTVSQSSTLGAYSADKAVNGNLDDTSITGSQALSWWEVDLEGMKQISNIKIYPRPGVPSQATSMEVSIFDNNRNMVFNSYVPDTSAAYNPVTVPNVVGRYVKIQLRNANPDGNYYLSLGEVQVNGNDYTDPVPAQSTNWAYNRTTVSQSSTYTDNSYFGAAKAVNGVSAGKNIGDLAITKNEGGSWWQVDLGSMKPISKIVITPRMDGLSQTDKIHVSLLNSNSQEIAYQATATTDPFIINLPANTVGRYVRVWRSNSDTDYLSIGEVQVWDSQSAVPLVPPSSSATKTLTLTRTMTGGDAFVYNKSALTNSYHDDDDLTISVNFTPF